MFALVVGLSLSCQPLIGECGLADTGGNECAVDTCAETCTSLAEGRSCCIGTHGRGLTGASLATMERICRSCEPANYVGEDAALCIAQVHGLPRGVADCAVALERDQGKLQFRVNSTWSGSCAAGSITGSEIMIDARTGELLSGPVPVMLDSLVCDTGS